MQTALVTGASTGIGLATAVTLAKSDYTVTATVRSLDSADGLRRAADAAGVQLAITDLDVTDQDSVDSAVEGVLAQHGQLDVLVNNAGRGRVGTTERIDVDQLQATLDVNLIGVWRMTRAALPHMRTRGSGRIVTVTSIGGVVAQPFNDAYCAAKFAVEGMMESLAPVAAEFGVDVILIEPGAVATNFVQNVDGLSAVGDPDDPYLPLLQTYLTNMAAVFDQAQSPQDVADVVLAALTDVSPKLRYQTSDSVTERAATKLADTTGSEALEVSRKRLTQS